MGKILRTKLTLSVFSLVVIFIVSCNIAIHPVWFTVPLASVKNIFVFVFFALYFYTVVYIVRTFIENVDAAICAYIAILKK